MRAVGKSVGIDFAFDRIERQPNTLDAHRLISWAQAQGDAEDVVERLFRAYFLEGRLIGDRDVLAAIAGEAGLSAAAAPRTWRRAKVSRPLPRWIGACASSA